MASLLKSQIFRYRSEPTYVNYLGVILLEYPAVISSRGISRNRSVKMFIETNAPTKSNYWSIYNVIIYKLVQKSFDQM